MFCTNKKALKLRLSELYFYCISTVHKTISFRFTKKSSIIFISGRMITDPRWLWFYHFRHTKAWKKKLGGLDASKFCSFHIWPICYTKLKKIKENKQLHFWPTVRLIDVPWFWNNPFLCYMEEYHYRTCPGIVPPLLYLKKYSN